VTQYVCISGKDCEWLIGQKQWFGASYGVTQQVVVLKHSYMLSLHGVRGISLT
jgi:hypothetical protein